MIQKKNNNQMTAYDQEVDNSNIKNKLLKIKLWIYTGRDSLHKC